MAQIKVYLTVAGAAGGFVSLNITDDSDVGGFHAVMHSKLQGLGSQDVSSFQLLLYTGSLSDSQLLQRLREQPLNREGISVLEEATQTLEEAGIKHKARIIAVLPATAPVLQGQPPITQPLALGIPGSSAGTSGRPAAARCRGVRAVTAGGAGSSSADIDITSVSDSATIFSQIAGRHFEEDAARVCQESLSQWFSWLSHDDGSFRKRIGIEAKNPTRDANVFSYVRESAHANGHLYLGKHCDHIRFILSQGAPFPKKYTPLPLPEPTREFSLLPPRRVGMEHKYFVGEAYAGDRDEELYAKLDQLDDILGIMMCRWQSREENRGRTDVGITHLISMAAIILFSGQKSAQDKAKRVHAMFSEKLTKADEDAKKANETAKGTAKEEKKEEEREWPWLRALMGISRFCVIVLQQGQCPSTTADQALAHHLASIVRMQREQQREVSRKLDTILEKMVWK